MTLVSIYVTPRPVYDRAGRIIGYDHRVSMLGRDPHGRHRTVHVELPHGETVDGALDAFSDAGADRAA